MPAHGAAGIAVFQRDLSKPRMPSQTMLRKKYRISQTGSFCSFSPTRHAAKRVTTKAAMLMIGPMTGIQLSRTDAPMAMRISQGLRSPSLLKTM